MFSKVCGALLTANTIIFYRRCPRKPSSKYQCVMKPGKTHSHGRGANGPMEPPHTPLTRLPQAGRSCKPPRGGEAPSPPPNCAPFTKLSQVPTGKRGDRPIALQTAVWAIRTKPFLSLTCRVAKSFLGQQKHILELICHACHLPLYLLDGGTGG